MGVLHELRKDDSLLPPERFLRLMRIEDRAPDFQEVAWRLFKRRGKRVAIEDVEAYLARRARRGKRLDLDEEYANNPTAGMVESHFLDSGAFTIWTEAAKYEEKHKHKGQTRWDYYRTKRFRRYMDEYAGWVKEHLDVVDLYANVDAIPHPEVTWENQQYLEKEHGLHPVPVVHYRTDLKWLKHYMDRGYEIIGLGGLVGSTSQESCRAWLDRAFEMVCDGPGNLPRHKMHGFGVTSHNMMTRYPWWSVDSTSWTKVGAYGGIIVPHKRRNQFVYNEQPYILKVSMDSPDRKSYGKAHYELLSPDERRIVREWLEEIEIPLGRLSKDGTRILEFGVITHHAERKAANLLYFERMRAALPEYPWPFTKRRLKGFGFV